MKRPDIIWSEIAHAVADVEIDETTHPPPDRRRTRRLHAPHQAPHLPVALRRRSLQRHPRTTAGDEMTPYQLERPTLHGQALDQPTRHNR